MVRKRKATPRQITNVEANNRSFSVVGLAITSPNEDVFELSAETVGSSPHKKQRQNHFGSFTPKNASIDHPFYPLCRLELKIPKINSLETEILLQSQKFTILYSLQSTNDPNNPHLLFSLYNKEQDHLLMEQTIENQNIQSVKTSFDNPMPLPSPNIIQSLAHCLTKPEPIFYLHFVL